MMGRKAAARYMPPVIPVCPCCLLTELDLIQPRIDRPGDVRGVCPLCGARFPVVRLETPGGAVWRVVDEGELRAAG